jgi:parvulin-like peptidyl-prolyl isomerase
MRPIFVILLILSCFGCSPSRRAGDNTRLTDGRIVLQVGDQKFTLGDLERQSLNVEFSDAKQEYDLKKYHVEQFFQRFLLIEGAREAGITAELDSITVRKNLIRIFYDERVTNKIEVSETEIDRFFDKYGGEIQVGHLLVSDRKLAESLYVALEQGADFEDLVFRFSRDERSRERGGSMGYSQFGTYDENFEEAAFGLKIGQISRPVETRFGWHLIKLHDRIKHAREDLEANRKTYRNLAKRRERQIAEKRFRGEIKAKYHYVVLKPMLEFLIQKADSIRESESLQGDLPSSAYLDSSIFTGVELDGYVIRFDGGGTTVRTVLERLGTIQPDRRPDLRQTAVMEDFFEEITLSILIEQMAREEGFDRSPEFQWEVEFIKGSSLIQKMRDAINKSASEVSDADIANYFRSHRDEFYHPDQIRASGIALKTRSEAEELRERINGGANFFQVARKYSVDKKTGAGGGDLNYFTVARFTPIYQAAENLRVGEVGGPVEFEQNWWIFKLTDRKAKRPKSLEAAAGEIKSRLLNERITNAYDEFIARMKEKVSYKMDLELLKNNLRSGKYVELAESKG